MDDIIMTQWITNLGVPLTTAQIIRLEVLRVLAREESSWTIERLMTDTLRVATVIETGEMPVADDGTAQLAQ